MKLNETTKIVGEKVILIPYEAKHVEKYHRWMQNPELQVLTASEPLTIDEEYEMQKSWRNDEDKCTFLILSKSSYEETNNVIDSLVGDTNLFLEAADDGCKVGEAEIMIAEESCRGQGLGWESMLLMLHYGQAKLGIGKFIVKIGLDNVKSINMFSKMQFNETSRSVVFKEVTMERQITSEWIAWLGNQINFKIETYDRNLLFVL